MRSILALSLTRMGDIIQSIPFFRALRRKHPSASIDVLVENSFADVAGFIPGIDNLIRVRLEEMLPCLSSGVERDLAGGLSYYSHLIEEISKSKYDQVWNLTHTRPLTVLTGLIGGESARGVTIDDQGLQKVNDRWLRYFFATNLARPWCQFNLVDIYANCVALPDKTHARSVLIDEEQYKDHLPDILPKRVARHRVALHPGASQFAKQWKTSSFVHLAGQLRASGCETVVVGGVGDRKLSSSFPRDSVTTDLIGQTSPRQLAAVLSECDLLVSNDSGPMHVAAAVGTPVIAITIGSAVGSETAPYGEGNYVIEPSVNCFPCSARRGCPNNICADQISPDLVSALASRILTGQDRGIQALAGEARIYRTEFDPADLMLNLTPVFTNEISERDRIHRLMRPLWLDWLSGTHRSQPPRDISLSQSLAEHADRASRVAHSAAQLCTELTTAGHGEAGGILSVLQLSRQLSLLDARLENELLSEEVLKSLLAYMKIEISSVDGTDLRAQAGNTATVYKELCRTLKRLASAITPSIANDKTNQEIAEVHHENIT